MSKIRIFVRHLMLFCSDPASHLKSHFTINTPYALIKFFTCLRMSSFSYFVNCVGLTPLFSH
jgi:hypothetical protein